MYSKAFKVKNHIFLLSLLVFAGCIGAQAQKMAPEEIIAKHIASIGKKEIVQGSKKMMAIGGSTFEIINASKQANGRAVLASDGSNYTFVSTFNMNDYKMERIGYFSNKIDIPFVIPGRHSPLGTFLSTYNKFLDNRIFGGSIFSSWLFLGPKDSWGKLETEGKKKVGDREAWVVNYIPTGGGLTPGSSIKLYFDAENFHHLRTVYRQKEKESGFSDQAQAGSDDSSSFRGVAAVKGWNADMASNGSTLTEDFEDIRNDGGMTQPHKYSILLALDGASGTSQFRWHLTIEEYRLIKDFPANFFSFNSGPPE
jgi:hypothetical protein